MFIGEKRVMQIGMHSFMRIFNFKYVQSVGKIRWPVSSFLFNPERLMCFALL